MTRTNRMRGLLTALAVLLLSAPPAHAQVCGDIDHSISITTTDAGNPMRIQAWSRSKCCMVMTTHFAPARWAFVPSCGSRTATRAVPLDPEPAPTATHSSANHDRVTSRWCLVYFCGSYQTRGRHYFDGGQFSSTFGNTMPGGDCGGNTCNPCTPGYAQGGNCAPNQQDQCGCCPDPCPLIIDRSGDGLHLSGADDGALIDINGLRAMFWLGWPTTSDDAWLAYDRNGNGIIDDGSELFGNTRRLASGRNAENGYEVLAELDEDKNAVVDARDPLFAKLLLWGDANRNGVSEPRELTPLSSTGIKSLGVVYDEIEKTDAFGNRFRFIAADRSSIDVFPVWDLPDSAKSDKR